MNGEREINLLEMLLVACLKWRRILLIAVIVAVLAGGISAFKYVNSFNKTDAQANVVATKTAEEKAEETQLIQDIKSTERALADQQEYNENSWMMEIDPKNQWMGLVTIYIKPEFEIAQDALGQCENPALRICYAYSDYVNSDAFYDSVITNNKLDFSNISYLRELVSLTVNTDVYAIDVLVTADTEENCNTLLRLLEKNIRSRQQLISSIIEAHTLVASDASVYSAANLELERTQADNRDTAKALAAQLDSAKARLEKLNKKASVAEAPKASVSGIVKKAGKSFLIGGVAAILVLGMFYCVNYILNQRVYGEETFDGKLHTIGELPERGKGDAKGLDALIMKLFGVKIRRNEYAERAKIVALQASKLAEANGTAGNGKIALVSDMPAEELDELAKNMLDTNDKIYAAGNILSDYQAALESTEASSVMVVVKCSLSRRDSIRQMIAQLYDRKANVLGVLFTDVIAR